MDAGLLQRALRLGASWIGGAGFPDMLLAERILAHGLPQVLVLGRTEEDLVAPLDAIAAQHRAGLQLNLLAVPVGDLDPGPMLLAHRRRLGSLLCALDAGLSCWMAGPALPRKLPGWLEAPEPLPLAAAPLGPLDRAQLQERLGDRDPNLLEPIFAGPRWEASGTVWRARLWPGIPVPLGAVVTREPLTLSTATPVAEALRAALRAHSDGPVPFLPFDEDPIRLHALRLLAPEIGAFRGSRAAWEEALKRLAALPAPPHFCARC